MPYIREEERQLFKAKLQYLVPVTDGQLNFLITTILQDTLKTWGESYKTYNTLIGVLECVKLELYRRKVSVYEDKKCTENGDVY